MGKKKLAASIRSTEHSTEVARYSNQGLEVHIRGWDSGIMVDVEVDDNDNPIYVIHRTGGSNSPKRTTELYRFGTS
jgi:hypothetical protein